MVEAQRHQQADTASIEVRKVESKADYDAFFRFPWQIYPDQYPNWVSELPSMRHETLDRKHHAAWEYLKGDYFVAWRDAQPVGTIAAFVNPRHNAEHEENIGFFGFFECIEDEAVAHALLRTAEAYLRDMGVDAIRGPANFSSNETYGLLIEGYDKQPTVLMPYNPPYYATYLESYGFEKAMDLYSWRATVEHGMTLAFDENGDESRQMRTIRRAMERREITVRRFDPKNKQRDFQILRDLYHSAWQKNWGFIPLTEREMDDLIKNLGLLLMPKYTFFCYVKGEPAGFLLMIPNLNQVFAHVKPHPGLPEVWWYLKTLWHWKIRNKITGARSILMGVKEQYRGLGVDAAIYVELIYQLLADQHFTWIEASWILETNTETNKVLKNFGCDLDRVHRLYQKTL